MDKRSKKSRQTELDRSIRMTIQEENSKLFSEQERQRFSMGKEKKRCLQLLAGLIVFAIVSIFLLNNLMDQDISLAVVAHMVILRVNDFVDLLLGNHLQSAIGFWIMELVCPVVAGIALAIAGAAFQAIFHNPMASPTLLGIQSGGALGATVFVTFFYTPMLAPMLSAFSYDLYLAEYTTMTFMQKYGQFVFTLAGCVVVVLIIMVMAKISGRGKIQTVPLMVGGTIFASCISAIINLVEYYETTMGGNEAVVQEVRAMQSGAFQVIVDPVVMIGFVVTTMLPAGIALFCRNRLNVIAFGEEEARVLGIDVGRSRTFFIMLATIMTASVIAFCGNIAFVGLIVPHMARQIVGNDYKQLLPASAVLGSIFMLLAYDLSYMFNSFLNLGAIVGIVGSFVFVITMMRYRRRGNADWA